MKAVPLVIALLKAEPVILYYACGGGLGHVTRAAAILRHLKPDIMVLVLTSVAEPYPLIHEGIPFRYIAPDEYFSNTVIDFVSNSHLRVLLMDVFPLGLRAELTEIIPKLACKKVFIYRHVRADYRPTITSALPYFDQVIFAETADPPLPVETIACQPILLREGHELRSRDSARQILGVTSDVPVVLGVSSTDDRWTKSFFPILRKALLFTGISAHLSLAAPGYTGEGAVDYYPLLELLPGVDVVVGAGGYNLYHEVHSCGVPAIFLPQPRTVDDQHWRTQSATTACSPEELEARLREALLSPRIPTIFSNNAITAVDVLSPPGYIW